MVDWPSRVSQFGYKQLSVIHGTVSWPGAGDEAGWLQLWYNEMIDGYCIISSKTAGNGLVVCELLMFYSFTSKTALTKSKRYELRSPNFILSNT